MSQGEGVSGPGVHSPGFNTGTHVVHRLTCFATTRSVVNADVREEALFGEGEATSEKCPRA
jgi:hypothetical protein